MERKGVVTFKGNGMTLVGAAVKAGDKAPEFKTLDNKLNETGLKDFKGKVKLISITPSLDTPVCDAQARRFNIEAAKLPDSCVVINVSMDLPFAISRFCAAAGIERIKTLSDHREASFGIAYGVLVKELRLLARSVFVIDAKDMVRYVEVVPEITNHPDYEKALDEARKLLAVRA